jgi:hypothetical protein
MRPRPYVRPSEDKAYHGTVITPHVKGVSKKFRGTGNCCNVRIMFKTKHTLRGILMRTGPVRDAQQTKQCVYSIPCDCGRCYIGETSGYIEVCIKETQSLLEKSKLAQNRYE